jgi:hypothetical protein
MIENNFLTLLVVLLLGGVFAYRMSFLQRKRLWHLSLQQVLQLVVLPGVFFPLIFSYVLTLMAQPLADRVILSDRFLVNMILLSVMFTYGAIAMHAVTKILNEHLSGLTTEAAEINKFFHMTFSHNLGYAGGVLLLLGITLLELNHVVVYSNYSMAAGVIRGVLLALGVSLATINYTRYSGGDVGKWGDLKVFFAVVWLAMVILIYSIRKVRPEISEYQLLLPSLLGFSVMAIMGFVLVVRRVRRHWQLRIRRRAVQQLLEDAGVSY